MDTVALVLMGTEAIIKVLREIIAVLAQHSDITISKRIKPNATQPREHYRPSIARREEKVQSIQKKLAQASENCVYFKQCRPVPKIVCDNVESVPKQLEFRTK